MADDKMKHEIEDILNRLDSFVPEESAVSRMRRRSSGRAATFARALLGPLARISLSQVLLTSLALIIVAFFGRRVSPVFNWVMIAALLLFLTAFALSLFNRGPTKTEHRWRGRIVELDQPSLADRLRAWLQAKRRPRR